MFDRFLIRSDSLENVVEDGRVTGFKFAVRIADYRGCFLSLHNGYYLECDGVEYPRESRDLRSTEKRRVHLKRSKRRSGSTGTMMTKESSMSRRKAV